MSMIRRWFVQVTIVGLAANLRAWPLAAQGVSIGAADLAGVVTGPNGPEAGVWVIAETHDLPTKFVRIVVTDDQGRYLIPDLPKATYAVWVRGYGLVDSPHVQAAPGKVLNLTAVAAPNPRAAAQYYPAGYWFSLLRVPGKREFAAATSTGSDETHTAPAVKSQAEWLRIIKSGGCWACHQLGSEGTRAIPKSPGTFPSSVAAWERRLQSGQAGAQMMGTLSQLGAQRALAMFADWTDRIAAGAVPPPPLRHAAGGRVADAATVALLGQRAHLDQQGQRAQPDVRRAGSRVAHRHGAPARQSGRLQGGLEPSLGEAFPTQSRRSPPRGLRSQDPEAHAHRHLLQYPPPHVRGRREPDAVDLGGRPGRGLVEYQAVRRDGRRRKITGLDRPDPRHQRQRQAGRVCRARSAGRSRQGQTDVERPVHRGPGSRRVHLGDIAGLPGRRRTARSRPESAGNRPRGTVRAATRPVRRADRRVFTAWRRRGPQRRLLDCAGERPPRELRSKEMHASAQRTDGDGPALPRRLDLLS